nr:sensor histidine kinase [uncultured Solibaculum sp.]
MKQEKWYAILSSYLKQYRFTALLFSAFVGIFAAIFSLYELKAEAIWYSLGLCVLLVAVVLSVHFFFYWKRHQERLRVLQNVQIMLDQLPEPKTLAEADLQEMLKEQRRILDNVLTSWRTEQQESMDYYTTWVHQIKTPISVMRMILESEDTEEHRELSAELFRIEQYVEMVLSYLRLGSESSDYVFQEYDLDDIIKQAIHKYASQFVRGRIRLVYQPAHVSVLTDEKWLLFIIEQILSNSIKYTREGTVTIIVTPERVLKISDTGIGIASEDLPRIFEKGFTGYNGRSDKKSTGLGLYLCKTAADRLSYKISAQSTPGVGTTISLDLHTDQLQVE